MSPLPRRPVDRWTVTRAELEHQPPIENLFRAQLRDYLNQRLFLLPPGGPVVTPSPLARWHAAKAHAEQVWASL